MTESWLYSKWNESNVSNDINGYQWDDMTHGNISWCVVHGYYCRLVRCNFILWIDVFPLYCMNSFDTCIYMLYELINWSNPYIHVMQAPIIKRWIICDCCTLSYWQNIPWKFQNYPISKEVGLPCYLSLSFFELVSQTHTFVESFSYNGWRGCRVSFPLWHWSWHIKCSDYQLLCYVHFVQHINIYHLLPCTKSQNGKLIELTEVGRSWGEYTWHIIVFMILFSETYLFFHDQ